MRIGIDLGGTKIEAVVLADDGREVHRRRVATPQGDYVATVEAIAGLVADAERAAAQRCTVGVGVPGVPSPATGLMKNANSTWLIGHPLGRDLEARLGRHVRIANDANCFALSEAQDGAGAGFRVVFGVIVGTGTGAGIVVDGKVLVGPNGIAGEWGHVPMPWMTADEFPGLLCYCGKRGCVETFLSGPAITRDHEAHGGAQVDVPEIARRAAAGDDDARATLERHTDRMARALAGVVTLLDPDVIVLGGGISNLPHLVDEVPRRWGRYAFSDRVDTALRRNVHGDSSGVRGAAWLWPAGAGVSP